jgi:hypothetical protein
MKQMSCAHRGTTNPHNAHPHLQNGKSRWQLWGEDGKNMREYVEEHSSEGTMKQLRAAPGSKVGGEALEGCLPMDVTARWHVHTHCPTSPGTAG